MPGGLTLLASADINIPTPATGKVTVFFSTNLPGPAYKNDAGVVFALGTTGSAGPVGSIGPSGPPIFIIEDIQGEDGLGIPGPVGPSGGGGGGSSDWDTTVVAVADQSVTNSTTVVDKTDLVTAVVAGGVYLVEYNLVYSGNDVSADFKWEFAIPTAVVPDAYGFYCGVNNVDSIVFGQQVGAINKWPQSNVNQGTDGVNGKRVLFGRFCFTCNANGNIQFKFACGSAAPSRTTTCHIGSIIRVKQLA